MVAIAFHSLRGSVGHAAIHVEISHNFRYLKSLASEEPFANDRGTHYQQLNLGATRRCNLQSDRRR
jgi:hypothetical protein